MYFLGTFQHTLDVKNRLFIPARFRDGLGERFVVMRAPDRCLFIYDDENWIRIMSQVRSKSATAEDRARQRNTYRGIITVTPDKQGRITLPQELIEYAGLGKEVVIFGCDNRIELWSREAWDAGGDTQVGGIAEIENW